MRCSTSVHYTQATKLAATCGGDKRMGCMGTLGVFLAIGLLLLAVKWVGIPLGLILIVYSLSRISALRQAPEEFWNYGKHMNLICDVTKLHRLFYAWCVFGSVLMALSVVMLFAT